MIFEETFEMWNGVTIPKLALGTWLIENANASDAVKNALEIGYRHIDTAQAYGNEAGVGDGIRRSGIPRAEIFITSKVAAERKSYEAARTSIDNSLKQSGLDYLDLMLIHCPQPWSEYHQSKNHYLEENRQVWRAMGEAYQAGKLRAIGVSNFEESDLENIFSDCSVKPMVNQILVHIAHIPMELIRYCQKKDILVEAYSPIAHGDALHNPMIQKMAQKYKVSVAQLCIQYILQLCLVALPKTESPDHMRENATLAFEITDTDMKRLYQLQN